MRINVKASGGSSVITIKRSALLMTIGVGIEMFLGWIAVHALWRTWQARGQIVDFRSAVESVIILGLGLLCGFLFVICVREFPGVLRLTRLTLDESDKLMFEEYYPWGKRSSYILRDKIRGISFEPYSNDDWSVFLAIDGERRLVGDRLEFKEMEMLTSSLGQALDLKPLPTPEFQVDDSGSQVRITLFKLEKSETIHVVIDRSAQIVALEGSRPIPFSTITGVWLQSQRFEAVGGYQVIGLHVDSRAFPDDSLLRSWGYVELFRGLSENEMRSLAKTLAGIIGVSVEEREELVEWGTW